MGQRCNLVVVEDGKYELYYSHWGANSLDRNLFWGPEASLAYIRAQVSEAEGAAWLDDQWAEGGAVLDRDRQRLTWFGGEDILFELHLRRRLLELMRRSWAHWEVRWAGREIVDIAEAVGRPAESVLTPKRKPSRLRFLEPSTTHPSAALFSVRQTDGQLQFISSNSVLHEDVGRIERIVEAARSLGAATCDLGTFDRHPEFGAHVDVAVRSFIWWSSGGCVRGSERLLTANRGWSVDWVGDHYEAQLEACEGRLSWIREPTAAQIDEHLRGILLHQPRDRGVMMSELASALPNAEVDPIALRDDPLTLSVEVRRARLAALLG